MVPYHERISRNIHYKKWNGENPLGLIIDHLECWKVLGAVGIKQLTVPLDDIYAFCEMHIEMSNSFFITIPKMLGEKKRKLFSTILLTWFMTKLMLAIILNRVRNKIEIWNSQLFGFVLYNRGNSNAIFTLNTIIERSIEMLYVIRRSFSQSKTL